MKIFVRVLLIANTLFELAVAVGSAVGGLTAAPIAATQLVLAGNALALGLLSMLSVRSADATIRRVAIQVFTTFHWAVTIVWIIVAAGGSFNPALIAHGLFALAFTAALLRKAA